MYGTTQSSFGLTSSSKVSLQLLLIDINDMRWEQVKTAGFKAVCFDKDNVLTRPYSFTIHASFIKSLLFAMKTLRCAVLSNSVHQDSMLEVDGHKLPIIGHLQKKPAAIDEVLKHFDPIRAEEIVFVGDRLLTDIYMAKKAGMFAVYITDIISAASDNFAAAAVRRMEQRWAERFSREAQFRHLKADQIRMLCKRS